MKSRLFAVLILPVMLLAACTEVELCPQTEHPHTAYVTYDFTWDTSIRQPDTMAVVAYRIVNDWKQAFSISSKTKKGFYMQRPETTRAGETDGTDTEETDGTGTETDGTDTDETDGTGTETDGTETETDGTNTDEPPGTDTEEGGEVAPEPTPEPTPGVDTETDVFKIRQGDYKFVAVSGDKNAQDLSDIYEFIDNKKVLRDVYVNYYDYDKNDPLLQSKLAGWTDYNQYARYIQPGISPIIYDTVSIVKVNVGQKVHCKFKPKGVTQNIDIYFNIDKNVSSQPFVIDSVWAEVSGVPRSISLANGWLDITHTAKMMFRTELLAADGTQMEADTYDNSRVRCHGNIDVTSIVNVQKLEGEDDATVKSKIFGPGIMQVIIFTHSQKLNSEGKPVTKKIQGLINLYNTLSKAKLIKISEDGRYAMRSSDHATLNINAQMTIDGSSIEEHPDDTGGIDRWQTVDDIIIEI